MKKIKLILLLAALSSTFSTSAQTYEENFSDAPIGMTIGYVNKQWISTWQGETRRENMFLEEGKRLHGVQIGLQYNPYLPFGLGIRTGLYYELYISESPAVKQMGWDKFTEHNLYIPAHASFRIPFGDDFSMTVFGGIGFQWAIYGQYREWGHEAYDYWTGTTYYNGPQEYQQYGNGWPRHVNWQLECGCNLRFNHFQLGFTYSYGLTDHHFYTDCKTRQDKLSINLGYVL